MSRRVRIGNILWQKCGGRKSYSMNKAYDSLRLILEQAEDQAEIGKGHERHEIGNKPFEEQISCWIQKEGFDYARGQCVKKLHESLRLPPDRAIHEILGAINFCAIAILGIKSSADKSP